MSQPVLQQATIDLLEASLANSPTFQQFVGAVGDPVRAAESIYQDIVTKPNSDDEADDSDLVQLRPYIIIYTEENETGFIYEKDATGLSDVPGGGCWRGRGTLRARLERSLGNPQKPGLEERKFRGYTDGIVRDIADQCETAGRLAATRFVCEGPYRIIQEQARSMGDFHWAWLTIQWGFGSP